MKTLHVVSHTHWDREWYRTFQQFRFRFVGLMDTLLELLAREPDYRFFMLDGQTIILDDYLEIRPGREAEIRHLVEEGRILIGPWYVLPDEFLAGPEALVRNLQFGQRACRRFTAAPQPMERIGYIPDPFGHISQLPQIAAGFDMDALCFWRGVGDAPTEFRWAAPDGTERLVLHLRHSYSNGAWLASDEEGFVRDLGRERDALAPHCTTSHLLLMHGTDHMGPRADLPNCLRVAEVYLGDRVVHSTLPAYLAAVQAELGQSGIASLPRYQGEMRSSERSHLLPGVLSARTWIKQKNAGCEALLTRWAEPSAALAEQLTGHDRQRGFLRVAWGLLLQNQPHDSICGCSIDQVHREMVTRFDWCKQIGEQVTLDSLETIAHYVNTPEADDRQGSGAVIIFNPTPRQRTDRVRVQLKATPANGWTFLGPAGEPVAHRQVHRLRKEHLSRKLDRAELAGWAANIAENQGRVWNLLYLRGLEITGAAGTAGLVLTIAPGPLTPGELSSLEVRLSAVHALLADEQIQEFRIRVVEDEGVEVELLARDVPALGYAQVRIAAAVWPTPGLPANEQQTSARIENEFFEVEPDPADGTLTIIDKQTGLVVRGANRFQDGGDRGDEYNYCPPEQDAVIRAPVEPPVIRRMVDELGSALEIDLRYRLPRALADGNRAARSADSVEVPITTRVSLMPGVRRIEFATTVDNRAEDHRLRVHFPTPIRCDRSWAESHFDVVERPVALPQAREGWAEQPVSTQPQLTFVDVCDGRRGVLLANRGLPEVEVLPAKADEAGVTIALTLLRCVGWLSRGDLANRDGHAGPDLPTPEAQCPGQHLFHYALVPHKGNYLTALPEAHAFTAPLRAVHTLAHKGPLPTSASLLDVRPAAVVVTAVKPPEAGRGVIVRLCNLASVEVEARLKLWHRVQKAWLVPLSEAGPGQSLVLDGDLIRLPIRAKQIATLRLEFENGWLETRSGAWPTSG